MNERDIKIKNLSDMVSELSRGIIELRVSQNHFINELKSIGSQMQEMSRINMESMKFFYEKIGAMPVLESDNKLIRESLSAMKGEIHNLSVTINEIKRTNAVDKLIYAFIWTIGGWVFMAIVFAIPYFDKIIKAFRVFSTN